MSQNPIRPSETQVLKNYFEVPEEILEDAEELTAWAREAAARKGKRRPQRFHQGADRSIQTKGNLSSISNFSLDGSSNGKPRHVAKVDA